MGQKTPKSPRMSLPEVVEKMLEVLDKEGLTPVAPDVMAKHLGYKSARSGRAGTVLGTIRMYGLIEKGPDRKDVISKTVQKFRYTPNLQEKYEICHEWLSNPKLFSYFLEKYPTTLPSDEAFRYELIHDFNFDERSANHFIQIFKDSYSFCLSFSRESTDKPMGQVSEHEKEGERTSNVESNPLNAQGPDTDQQENMFKVQIVGPNMNSIINIEELDDLEIVKIMLRKIEKNLDSKE